MDGGCFVMESSSPLDDLLLSLSSAARPRVCFVPTPAGDRGEVIAAFFETSSRRDFRGDAQIYVMSLRGDVVRLDPKPAT